MRIYFFLLFLSTAIHYQYINSIEDKVKFCTKKPSFVELLFPARALGCWLHEVKK
jgi:hypothetical protein